jgi:hypothetical protein
MKELTLKDIKVGKKYKVKPKYKDRCVFCSGFGFDYIKITAINDGDLYYDAIKDGRVVGSCTGCYEPEHLEPLAPTCFEELRAGDVVVDENNEKRTVLFGNGLVIITEIEDGSTTTYSKKEFERWELTISNAKPELDTAIQEAKKLLEENGYKIIKE